VADVNRFATIPGLLAIALGFYVAYRLFGSTSETAIKLTVGVGFLLAAVFCCLSIVLWKMISRPGRGS
jgi:hypothetical protein